MGVDCCKINNQSAPLFSNSLSNNLYDMSQSTTTNSVALAQAAAIQSLLDQVVNNKEGLFPDVEYQAKLTVAMGKLLVCLYFIWILYSGC